MVRPRGGVWANTLGTFALPDFAAGGSEESAGVGMTMQGEVGRPSAFSVLRGLLLRLLSS